jgi:hypothetical protein
VVAEGLVEWVMAGMSTMKTKHFTANKNVLSVVGYFSCMFAVSSTEFFFCLKCRHWLWDLHHLACSGGGGMLLFWCTK